MADSPQIDIKVALSINEEDEQGNTKTIKIDNRNGINSIEDAQKYTREEASEAAKQYGDAEAILYVNGVENKRVGICTNTGDITYTYFPSRETVQAQNADGPNNVTGIGRKHS